MPHVRISSKPAIDVEISIVSEISCLMEISIDIETSSWMELSIQREISTSIEITFYATCPHIIKNQIWAGNLFYATCPHIIKNSNLDDTLFCAHESKYFFIFTIFEKKITFGTQMTWPNMYERNKILEDGVPFSSKK